MSKSDGFLYTGQTSASRRLLSIEKRTAERQKVEKAVLPNAEKLIELIQKERDNTIKSLLGTVDPSTSADDVKSLIVSLNLYKQSLAALELKVSNILRRANSEKESTYES